MINRLRVASQLPSANGISGGFIIDNITKRIKASVKSSESYARYVRAEALVLLTAATTITDGDDGKHFVFDSTTAIVQPLPAVSAANKGMKLKFTIKQLPGASAHAVSPAEADKIMGNGFTPADDKDAIFTAASDRIGDTFTLESDGVDGWFISGVEGTVDRGA